jgi:proline iminopeptidase
MKHPTLAVSVGVLVFLVCVQAKSQTDRPTGTVTVDGFKIAYYVEGTGIPCLVINDPLAMRRALSKELRKHFRFIFMNARSDAPHEGPLDAGGIQLDTVLDDIELVRRTVGIERVCVFGQSTHGLTAFEYARKYPEHVTHVIMNGTPPFWNAKALKASEEYWQSNASEERKTVLKRNREQRKDEIAKLPPDQAVLQSYITNGPMYWYDPTYDCSWLMAGENWNADVVKQYFDVIYANYDITSRRPTQVPIFLSLGRYDYAVPYTMWNGIKEKFPTLSWNLFEKSGHWAFLEEQELFDRKLIDWIDHHHAR